MRLKALEIQGFKTFPDKTKLSFTEGITAVVGPNGSGKSNISDAIRWVLGEQSAKALRCSRMEDVIFNGTQQRKKNGYAQVTLSFDNTDRTLQFDGDEIAITRRYYRSGNSEYLINNTSVRLQDIHELFMDTGLGRDGYSMIGQGKIDSIVATKGEDRREIFEEAAGISKFRYKKAEAERRLDKTEENLVRIRDIVGELESRVEPLRVQSEKAKSYLKYEEEKRGLEIALWLRAMDKSAAAVKEQDDKIAVADSQYKDIEKQLDSIQKDMENGYERQNEYTAKIEQLRMSVSQNDENAAQKRADATVLRNDVRHNEENISRIKKEEETFKTSQEDLQKEIELKKQKVISYRSELEKQKNSETALTEKLLQLKTGESDSADKIAEINRRLTELSGKISDAKVSFMTSSSSINELEQRMSAVENIIAAKRSEIATLKKIITEYEGMVQDCDRNEKKIQDEKTAADNAISEQKKKCSLIKKESEDNYLAARQLSDKARMLEELERNLEGFAQSVKAIMREAKAGHLQGIHGPVSRVIKTPQQYSTAIEIALGAAMQNIVTTDDKDAKNAIEYLKRHNGGRATFLPMSTIKGRELNENGLENCDGFVGIASELCSCDDCYRGILLNLLGRIVIAQDLNKAAGIAKKYSYRFRVVTLDGQVINAGGSLTGGSLSKNTGLLGRKTEIEQLKSQAAAKAEKGNTLTAQLREEEKILSQSEDALTELNRELSIVQSDKIKLEAEIRSRNKELSSAETALEQTLTERENSAGKMSELKAAMEKARIEMDKYQKEIAEKEEKIRSLTGSKDELIRRREKLTEELQDVKLRIMTAQKDISLVETEIETAETQQKNAAEKIRLSIEESESLAQNNVQLLSQAQTLDDEALALSKQSEKCRSEIMTLTNERIGIDMRSAELRKEEKQALSEKEKIGGELARLNERRISLQSSYDETVKKLWDEYELGIREARQCAAEISDPAKSQRRLNELKQKIRSLGNVNVSAIEEYKEVSERYTFMSGQLSDVEKSKSQLLKLIGDLTKQMREIFVEKFYQISKNFSETFVELFGGGKAELSLSDPENVLTTGIDITVEPPGKIVSHIELLSGGEKALVAIALYFAIMKVSPAPFCVMDEIEAALDDVNVYRFAEYLHRMNDRTQFICITHRRGTMEEADVLYGVTMQDRGISKLLELKAAEVEQKLGIK